MRNSAKISLACVAILFGFALNVSYAASNNGATDTNTYVTINNKAPASYMPRVYLDGYGGYSSGSLYMGTAELLQPVLLRYDRDLFIYGEGRFSNYQPNESWANSPWSGDLGLGYRQIVGQNWVLGGYLLGGYSKTPTGHGIIYANPGLEALGKVWDFRLNGYIPVSKREWTTQGWADNFGNNNYVTYKGHDEYDAWFIYHETAGIGGDAQVGRTLFIYKNTLVKGYVDGYYFSEGSNKSVTGGGAKITAQPYSYLKLSLSDNYDNYAHNVAMFGVEISLYDLFTDRSKVITGQDLQHRLFEPIDHNFAATGSGNVIPTVGGPENGTPQVIQYGPSNSVSPAKNPYNHHNTPERTNVWFYKGGNKLLAGGSLGNVGDGTYENPFSGSQFNQSWLKYIYDNTIANGLDANAYLFFNGGTYNAIGAKYTHLEIFPGESLWGRMGADKGYQSPATGANRPTFIGGLMLDSNTSVNNLVLQNNYAVTDFDTGITMNGATNVSINDSQIGIDGPGSSGYHIGIFMQNHSSLTIKNNSEIYGYNNNLSSWNAESNGVGLEIENGGNVTATTNSVIKGHSVYGNGIGLYVAPNTDGAAIINNITGDKTAKFVGLGDSDTSVGYGLYAASNTASNSNITIDSIYDSVFVGSGGDEGYGLSAISVTLKGTSTTKIGNITNSTFTGVTTGTKGSGIGTGLLAGSVATTSGSASTTIGDISGSNFVGHGDNQGYGLSVQNAARGNESTSIGSIINSGFSGYNNGKLLSGVTGIQASGSNINIAGQGSNANNIEKYMETNNDSFGKTPKGYEVCMNGNCI